MSLAEKVCTTCGESHPLTGFHRRASSPDGLAYICVTCTKAKHRAYYLKNREAIARKAKAAYDANPESTKKRSRKWSDANPERHREHSLASKRRRYEASGKLYNKRWREANRARYLAYKRLAAKRTRLTRDSLDYALVLLADRCSYCSGPAEHIDHIEASVHGGANDWTNLTAACSRCNTSKRDRSLLQHLRVHG